MTKLLILDRNGMITPTGQRSEFYNHVTGPMPGVSDTIQYYVADGWTVAITSDQSDLGISDLGIIDADACLVELKRTIELFPEVVCCVFCPNNWPSNVYRTYHKSVLINVLHEERFRKPNPGMLLWLCHRYSPTEVLYVGDRAEDEQAAHSASILFQWAHEWRTHHDELR